MKRAFLCAALAAAALTPAAAGAGDRHHGHAPPHRAQHGQFDQPLVRLPPQHIAPYQGAYRYSYGSFSVSTGRRHGHDRHWRRDGHWRGERPHAAWQGGVTSYYAAAASFRGGHGQPTNWGGRSW